MIKPLTILRSAAALPGRLLARLPRPRLPAIRFCPAWWWAAPAGVVALGLYYLIGGFLVNVIDSDSEFGPGNVTAPQSRAVAVAAALIHREVDVHRWTPNDPFFQPGWVLSEMPHYQQGIVAALSRYTSALSERQVEPDDDLRRAAGLLKYPGTVWKFDPATWWMPTASTEKQYRRAGTQLEAYNNRLAAGSATYDRRAEALAAALTDIGNDLAAVGLAQEAGLSGDHWALFDRNGSGLFFNTKGRMYGYFLLLREMGWDYAEVITDKNLGAVWRHLLDSTRIAAQLKPVIFINGAPDATVLPSHLAAQGFLVMRVRQQLDELVSQLAH